MHEILLYYKYTHVADPAEFCRVQRELCERLGLKGRIIIATEGINGTVEGTAENTQKYIDETTADARFKDMNFKRSFGTGSAFPRLSIKVRPELVSAHLGEEDVNPAETTGKYLEPEELHKWINSDKEFYIVDMRNDYEHRVGFFSAKGGSASGGRNSILLPMQNFRDLPSLLPTLEHLKNKTVVTVCTGGVRCEKASGYLVYKGFNDVYQLHNGIVSYMEKYPEEDFNGKLYVFDGRVTMGFNAPGKPHKIVGRCAKCQSQSENYVNCADLSCHVHFICCDQCLTPKGDAFCNLKCRINFKIKKFGKFFKNVFHLSF